MSDSISVCMSDNMSRRENGGKRELITRTVLRSTVKSGDLKTKLLSDYANDFKLLLDAALLGCHRS